jgi:tripartite ATP-independent transporter DctP family solute receptor
MRVATPTTNDPQVFEMEQFKKAVEAKSQGRIEVQLFPSSQLGNNSQMLQALRAGSLHGLLEPTAFLGGFDNVMTVIDLPYFFKDVQQATALLNGAAGDTLRKHLEETGLVALRYYEYGPRILLLKFPVKSMDDFKGKKVRVMGAQNLIDEINAWGGSGIAMGVPELFNALQQGTLDGLESAAQFFYSGKYSDVAKNLFMEPKGAEVTVFLTNKKWLESLPADLRKIVTDASVEITETANQNARTGDKDAIEKMKAAGVTVVEPSADLHKQLEAKAATVHEKFLKDNPTAKPIYDALKAAAGK